VLPFAAAGSIEEVDHLIQGGENTVMHIGAVPAISLRVGVLKAFQSFGSLVMRYLPGSSARVR
jgi:hypothetical protein